MRDMSDEEVRRLAGEPCETLIADLDEMTMLDCGRFDFDVMWCPTCRARRELARRERERGDR